MIFFQSLFHECQYKSSISVLFLHMLIHNSNYQSMIDFTLFFSYSNFHEIIELIIIKEKNYFVKHENAHRQKIVFVYVLENPLVRPQGKSKYYLL